MQTYFEEDYLKIGFDKIHNILIVIWKLAPSLSEYNSTLNSLLSDLIHFKTGKIVVDTTCLSILHTDNHQWFSGEWPDRALQAGYSHLAVVLPPDVFKQMPQEETMRQVSHLTYAYFDNREIALDWIKKPERK